MTVIVEDGTVVPGANSYVSETYLGTFASDRGLTLNTSSTQLLIEAMDYLDTLSFQGLKRILTQPLQWPRVNVYIDGYYVQADHIPIELKNGLCQIAVAIDEGNGPDADVPRFTRSERVGDLEVTYASGAPATVVNQKIHNALWKLLSNSSGYGLKVSKA